MDYCQNNNGRIIKRLATRSIRANKGRSIAAVSSVALSTCIMLTVLLLALGVNRESYNSVKNMYQAAVRGLGESEIESLESDGRFSGVGAMCWLDSLETAEGDLNFLYYNETMMENGFKDRIVGELPKGIEDVAVTRGYLELTGQNAGVGDTITVRSRNIDSAFRVTGIIDDAGLGSDTAYAFFSQTFVRQEARSRGLDYIAYLWLKDAAGLSEDEAGGLIRQVCGDYGIEAAKLSFNDQYFSFISRGMKSADTFAVIFAAGLVLFASAIVVYSIFYISVGNRIREYGQLRTLGASVRQIKKLVIYEGMTLAAVGTVLGSLASWVIAYALKPGGWYWGNTLTASLAALIIEIIVVALSVRTPARMAGKASPAAAGRYSGYNNRNPRGTKARHRKTTPLRLAVLNITRNPKKAALTISSLGLCGVLFVCAAGFQENVAAEKLLRIGQFKYGSFILELVGDENHSYSEIQQLDNPLSDTLRDQILGIEGVSGIRERRILNVTVPQYNDRWNIHGFTREDADTFKEVLSEGTADYDTLTQSNGLLISSPGDIEKMLGWRPQVGDKVTLKTLNGEGIYIERSLTVMGLIGEDDNFSGLFRATESTLQNIAGTPCLDSWEIITDTQDDMKVEQKLEALIKDCRNIRLNTFADTAETRQAELNIGWGLIFVLALILGVFGVINLINTNAANIFSRRREIGILQAVGMTKKQVWAALFTEGAASAAAAAAITAAIGLPVSYYACIAINPALSEVYAIPWQAPAIYLALLSAVQLLLTFYNISVLSRESITERVKNAA